MNERTSPGPVGAFWQLARPRTCLVGVLAYVFGFEITAGDWALRPALGILVALMVPAIANLHNTYTDVEEDRANLPGRATLVDVAQVRRLRWAVFGGLFAVVAIAGYSGLPQLIIALVGSLLLLAYSAPPIRAKARPVLGLFVFSLVVAVPFFAGATVSNGWLEWRSPWTLLTLGWLLFMVLFFMAKGLVKNVPDFHGDLAAGLRTSATVLGSPERAARVAVAGTWLVYLLLPVTVLSTGSPSSIFLLTPWIVVACWHVSRLLADRDVARLNQVLKWDMVVSVVTLAALAVSPRASVPAIVVVCGSLVVLAVADLIGKDSRAPQHLSTAQ